MTPASPAEPSWSPSAGGAGARGADAGERSRVACDGCATAARTRQTPAWRRDHRAQFRVVQSPTTTPLDDGPLPGTFPTSAT
ncbi:hypothetical protein HGI15_16990 [Modestobacter lapidis]|nr:hypothetical protein [Modestobacter lapidis]